MIYLLLSVLASTTIFVIFKFFEKFKINTFQAIVINYITASFCGIISYKSSISNTELIHSQWLIGAIILGVLFISVFYLMAYTTQHNGLSVASVSGKMSVIIPIIFGIYIYNERVGFQKTTGTLLALIAVYLTAMKSSYSINHKKGILLPFMLFLGSGIIDTLLKYVETKYVPNTDIPIFSATIFGCAAILGSVILMIKKIKNSFTYSIKDIGGGIILGIINYYSIFFLLRALQYKDMESSTIFTINNVAIVMLSTLIGLLIFKEHISKKKLVRYCTCNYINNFSNSSIIWK